VVLALPKPDPENHWTTADWASAVTCRLFGLLLALLVGGAPARGNLVENAPLGVHSNV
jgi:hypothetical protein